jgi:sec-independent protein translocase protein TatA
MNLGMMELFLILGIALLFFGPSKLPGLGKSLGEAIKGFKSGLNTDSEDEKPKKPTESITAGEPRPVSEVNADKTKTNS